MLWRLIVDIYEAKPYPIVTHIFTGKTKVEAIGYYHAHLRSDRFLEGCVQHGRMGRVKCRTLSKWEHV
jgi:hypothetical protein